MGKLEAGNFYGVINALLNYPERIKRIFVQEYNPFILNIILFIVNL